MSVYIRRFTEDPGLEVLLDIESVNIIDLEPPEAFAGIGTGTAILVAEFEDGPYNEVTEVFGPSDLVQTFGEFGYTYDGVKGNNPCARSRKADAAITPEYWNGNGFVHLNGKKFRRLILVRVDTSVGYVAFTRLAALTGLFKPTYDLEPGQILTVQTDLVAATNVTFLATAATVTGVGGVFAGVVAGDYIDLAYDGNPTVRVTFQAGDNSIAGVVARINLAFGFTFAADSGGELQLTGRRRGNAGEVSIVGGSGTIVTTFGHVVGVNGGGGNVDDIDAVTVAEVNALVAAAVPTLAVMRDYDQNIVIYNTTTTGVAEVEVVSATTTALDFGFPLDTTGEQATADEDVNIPAGTRVRNAGATEWVTTESIVASAAEYDGWTAKVRHALDDGTGVAAPVGTVNVIPFPVAGAIFAVTNPLPLSAAKTELEIDAAYYAAIQTTLDLNTVAREANFIWAARQSNICRRGVRENAILASERGCFGRMCAIRPPIGTTRAVAKGNAEPGIGAYRHDRVMYTFPGVSTYVPAIALKGTAGGAGFTANGVVNQGADGFAVSVCCRLPSEENPGQLTTFMDAVQGLESGAEYVGWTIDDYKAFKKKGIMAPRMDDGVAIFQSGVTSVDPGTYPAKVRVSRRRMADEIQDSLAKISKGYGKRLSSKQRRQQFVLDCKAFMESLLSPNDPTKQRIDSYSIDPKSGNTTTSLAAGAYYVFVKAKTYPSLDAIVLQTEIGENVTISEV